MKLQVNTLTLLWFLNTLPEIFENSDENLEYREKEEKKKMNPDGIPTLNLNLF